MSSSYSLAKRLPTVITIVGKIMRRQTGIKNSAERLAAALIVAAAVSLVTQG